MAQEPDLACSLLCGRAGYLLVEALLEGASSQPVSCQKFIEEFLELSSTVLSDVLDSDEWLYGRAGYLHGCLLIQHLLVEDRTAVSGRLDAVIQDVARRIIANGRNTARESGKPAPLLWRWYKEEYLGAAHGAMGILFTLLHIPALTAQVGGWGEMGHDNQT